MDDYLKEALEIVKAQASVRTMRGFVIDDCRDGVETCLDSAHVADSCLYGFGV